MKLTLLSAVCSAALFFSCSNENAEKQHKDSANMLQDTLPANSLKDSININHDPADHTHVDSMKK